MHGTAKAGSTTSVNLQGIQFDTNAGGRLPLEKSLTALAAERAALSSGTKSIADVARERGLSAKYLGLLWAMLHDPQPSLVLDSIRAKWRAGTLVAADVEAWQKSLWRFASVGHIGKKNGPRGWQEPVTPLASKSDMRLKLASPVDGSDLALYLSVGDAGDGNDNDFAVWENARLVAPGRADLPLRDVRAVLQQLSKRREVVIASAARCLAAAAEADAATERTNVMELAKQHGVETEVLAAWLDYLGIGSSGEAKLGPLLEGRMESTPDYQFIKGWTGADALSVIANSSDATVRVPGTMKAHGVAAHPSPNLAVVIAWRSPLASELRIDGSVQHAHPECGNGIAWSLELRRGHTRERLASGISEGATPINLGHFEKVRVLPGDVLAVVIGPRDGNHSCDLTAVDLVVRDEAHEWNLANDVSPDILAGNPHADRHGNQNVWHFFGEPATSDPAPTIPGGSLLTMWRNTTDATERQRLADQVQRLLERGLTTVAPKSPNRELYQQLRSYSGPLLSAALRSASSQADDGSPSPYGLSPARFGRHPNGDQVDLTSLCVQAPSVIEVRLPAELAEGAELVVHGRLHPATGKEGSVQMQLLATKPESVSGITASKAETKLVSGQWSDNNLRTLFSDQVIVNDDSEARQRFERAFNDFRQLFPAALCYTKIVPVDEVVTLTLFYREDDHLKRSDARRCTSGGPGRMWDEFRTSANAPQAGRWLRAAVPVRHSGRRSKRLRSVSPTHHASGRSLSSTMREVEPQQVEAVLDLAERLATAAHEAPAA